MNNPNELKLNKLKENPTYIAIMTANKLTSLKLKDLNLILKPLYSDNITDMTCFLLLIDTYTYVLNEPLFKARWHNNHLESLTKLLLSVFDVPTSLQHTGVRDIKMDNQISLTTLINIQATHMLETIRYSSKEWCKELILDYKLPDEFLNYVTNLKEDKNI